MSDSSELDLQKAVSCHLCAGNQSPSSAGATSVLNHSGLSGPYSFLSFSLPLPPSFKDSYHVVLTILEPDMKAIVT